MKVHITLALTALAGLSLPAASQTIVSLGTGLSHDCYLSARFGHDIRRGVDVCSQALQREMLNTRDKAATYDNRGVLLDQIGRPDEAEADFNAAIALSPQMGDPHVNLGSMLIKKRQYQAALEEINHGLEVGMSFPHIGYYDRAIAEQMLGRFREAYFDYKKVLELEPSFRMAEERLKDFTVVRKSS